MCVAAASALLLSFGNIGTKVTRNMIDKLALLHIHSRQLLAARSQGRDTWYLPGGKREPGESDSQALAREIREELGVEVIADSIRYAAEFVGPAHGQPPGTEVRVRCYHAQFVGVVSASAEIAEIGWIGLKDAARCSPVLRMILAHLQSQGVID